MGDWIDIRRYCPRIVGSNNGVGIRCEHVLDVRGDCDVHGSAFERCRQCGQEYLYPHLCRTHMLCGMCHPPLNPPVPIWHDDSHDETDQSWD